MAKKTCMKCGRQMEDTNFYTYKNGEKFEQCKGCITMHIDNFDESTYLWILQKADVPYIPQEWVTLRDRAYAKNPKKMNGMSVIGKYLSKMKLKQWKSYSWKDSQELQKKKKLDEEFLKEQQKVLNEQIKQQFENGEITEAQYKTLTNTEFQKTHQYVIDDTDKTNHQQRNTTDLIGEDNPFREENFISEEELQALDAQLTLEEKRQMAIKWGRTYKISEWIELQRKYTQMMNSFDIQDADSKNSLIFICKTYLKMNQAIDCGNIEEYQKLSRVYDALRKSAKFTAAQNKEKENQIVDSVGQLVAYCQKNGGQIPRYQIEVPYDVVDKIIKDLKNYNKELVYEDTALAKQIQDYIKQAELSSAIKKDKEQAQKQGFDSPQLSDEDIIKYKQFLQQQRKDSLQKEIAEE